MTDTDIECLKSLIEWAYQDTKQVLLLVGFELATLVVIISRNLFHLESGSTLWLAFIGMAILSGAAVYTTYIHKTHMAARALINHMHKADYNGGMKLIESVWTKNKWLYYIGHFLGIGALLAIFIHALMYK